MNVIDGSITALKHVAQATDSRQSPTSNWSIVCDRFEARQANGSNMTKAGPVPDQQLGALVWRNWKDSIPDSPPAYEATLYSDAEFTSGPELRGIGPYILFNTIAMRKGELGEALVVRWSQHLTEPNYVATAAKKKKQIDSWLGMDLPEEFAALLSLLLGARIRSGGITREFRDTDGPAGKPVAFGHRRPTWERSDQPILPDLSGTTRNLGGVPKILEKLPRLTAGESVALLRAARLYQLSIWVADVDPELGWLQLVSAAEVAADHWRGHSIDDTDVLRSAMPDLVELLQQNGDDELVPAVATILARLTKSTKRFLDFLLTFAPEPPKERCEEHFQVPWAELKKRLSLVYGYRSERLHGGIPFPAVMNQPPMILPETRRPCERPFGTSSFTYTSEWPASELPMYLWMFEYIVRGALIRWFREDLGSQGAPRPN